MRQTKVAQGIFVFGLPLFAAFSLVTICVAERPQQTRSQLRQPVFRVAEANRAAGARPAAVKEHPLAPALRIARQAHQNIQNNIKDYSCTIEKQEQVNGVVRDPEYVLAKIRNEKIENGRVVTPFSVYMYFLAPKNVRGQEALYIKGHNNGKMIAHAGGSIIGRITVELDPNGSLAMRNQRYPITELGLENLVLKLIEVAEHDMKFGECEVKWYKGAKVSGRVCTCIQVIHPVHRANFRFHQALIFIDDEYQVPIRYEAYDWPKTNGGNPILLEKYTYLNLKLNVGLTDADFDRNNPNYRFTKR